MYKRWVYSIIFAVLHTWSHCLGLKGPPKLHPLNRLVTAQEGQQIKLPCPITGSPEPLFEWRKDGRPVDDTWPRYVLRRHFLRIRGVKEEDAGEFTCTGVNGFGQEAFTFSLLIYGENLPPIEIQEPVELVEVSPTAATISAQIGETTVLICRATGFPAPKVSWSKDGSPLHHSGAKLLVTLNSRLDSGLYTCTATNPLGIVHHNFSIEIAGQDRSHLSKPEIVQAVNVTVAEGTNTTLQCTVRSSLPPEIQWLKMLSTEEVLGLPPSVRNNTLHREGRTYRYISSYGARPGGDNFTYLSQLKIGAASPYDAGVYACVGATTEGYNYKEIYLTLLPGVSRELPTITRTEDSAVNWLLLMIPAITMLIIVVVISILCKVRKTSPEKTYPTGHHNAPLEGEDPGADTPLHALKPMGKGMVIPTDVAFQDAGSFSTHLSNMAPFNGSIRYGEPFLFANHSSFLEPNYSDPYLDPEDNRATLDPRGSEHSYAQLTQSTQSSTSPLPPPPYAYQFPYHSPALTNHPHSGVTYHLQSGTSYQSRTHQIAYTSPHTKYVMHYNL